MRNIQNRNGPIGYGETSWETGDTTDASTRKAFFKNLVDRANSVPIVKIFKSYGLRLSEYNKDTICPFLDHKGGRESSASFTYYPPTNSFFCHGCRKGIYGTDFVVAMDGIPRAKAAYKILELFGGDVDDDVEFETLDIAERLEIMMEFSNRVRDFRQDNTDEKSLVFIENICQIYDDMNNKHKLDNESLRKFISILITQIK